MSLQLIIEKDIKGAMIQKDEMTVVVLRMVKSALQNFAKEHKKEKLTDEEVLGILTTQAKKRKESISAFTKGGRQELADQEKKELEIISKYLPAQLNNEEIKKVVQGVIDQAGESANFGQIMGQAMGRLKGQADGKQVAKIVKELMG